MHNQGKCVNQVLFEQLKSIMRVFDTILTFPKNAPWVEALNTTMGELPFIVESKEGDFRLAQITMNETPRQWRVVVDDEQLADSEIDRLWETVFHEHALKRYDLFLEESIIAINTTTSLYTYMILHCTHISFTDVQIAINHMSNPVGMFREYKHLLEVGMGTMSRVLSQPIKQVGYHIFIQATPIMIDRGMTVYAKYKQMDLNNISPYVDFNGGVNPN